MATEKMIENCGRTLVVDCTTRWNSTHEMLNHLISMKNAVNEVLSACGSCIFLLYVPVHVF